MKDNWDAYEVPDRNKFELLAGQYLSDVIQQIMEEPIPKPRLADYEEFNPSDGAKDRAILEESSDWLEESPLYIWMPWPKEIDENIAAVCEEKTQPLLLIPELTSPSTPPALPLTQPLMPQPPDPRTARTLESKITTQPKELHLLTPIILKHLDELSPVRTPKPATMSQYTLQHMHESNGYADHLIHLHMSSTLLDLCSNGPLMAEDAPVYSNIGPFILCSEIYFCERVIR
ncbi:hypothetical protein SBOR_2913 [Sclerotinia borealis F-4128]|uniref:Uncharacterized protein n=1 Tax=Sclerotinia borealis (strain F-4128) TaxID=1432307 RepID=W9CL12_SCLBF|nr:hypothetical protein SBOR_2913 [Sclerotinia borealis F-4128]